MGLVHWESSVFLLEFTQNIHNRDLRCRFVTTSGYSSTGQRHSLNYDFMNSLPQQPQTWK